LLAERLIQSRSFLKPAQKWSCTHGRQGTPMQFIRKEASPHVEEAAETHQIATMHGSQPPAGRDGSFPATARISSRRQRIAKSIFSPPLPRCSRDGR